MNLYCFCSDNFTIELNRDDTYDVLKGIGIIMMVAFHAYAPMCIRSVGCCFHMSVFFILAGWLFDLRHCDSFSSVAQYAKKRIIRLWWPAFACGGVFMLFHNQLLDWHIIHDLPFFYGQVPADYQIQHWTIGHLMLQLLQLPFLLGDFSKLAGAFWFLKSLLVSSMIYAVVAFLFRNNVRRMLLVQTLISAGMFWFGQHVYVPYFGALVGGGSMMTAYGLIHVGVVLKYYNCDLRRAGKCQMYAIGACCLISLMLLSRIGTVSLASNRFPSVWFLYACSLLGWFFMVALSSTVGGFAKVALAYLGKHTMPIILLHFLAFKVISAIGVAVYDLPLCRIADFSVTFTDGWWWLPYAIVGIGVPLLLNHLYNRLLSLATAYVHMNLKGLSI